MQTTHPSPSPRCFLSLIVLLLVTILLYANTFMIPFHFDDKELIRDNREIRYFSEPQRAIASNRARPALMVSFSFSYHLGGLNVFGYHLFNILLHSLSVVTLFAVCLLLARFFRKEKGNGSLPASAAGAGVSAALVFAAQPMNVEAVTYISGRSSGMAAFWLLISFFFFIKSEISRCSIAGRGLFLVGALAAFVVSLGSKEIGITLPFLAIIAGYYLFFKKNDADGAGLIRVWDFVKHRGLRFVPFFLVIIMLLAVRYSWHGVLLDMNSPFYIEHPAGSYPATQLNVVLYYYINKLFLPTNLNADIDFPVYGSFLNFPTAAAAVVLLSLIFYAVRNRFRASGLFFAVFWFFLTLALTSSFIPITDVAAERRLYLPGLGLAFFFLYFLSRVHLRAAGKVVCLTIIIFCFSAGTVMRNAVFLDELTLWRDTVAKSPLKARPHNNLGDTYNRLGYLREAVAEIERAIQIAPAYADARYNLGVVYGRLERKEDSLRELKMAELMGLDSADLHYNIGVLYADFGLPYKALDEYHSALKKNIDHPRTLNNMGVIYEDMGRYKDAAREYRHALSIDPLFIQARNNLGSAYQKMGKIREAIMEYREALSVAPDYVSARFNLANTLALSGRYREAVREHLLVLKLRPKHYESRYNLGSVYLLLGRRDEAIAQWKAALAVKPDFEAAKRRVKEVEQ